LKPALRQCSAGSRIHYQGKAEPSKQFSTQKTTNHSQAKCVHTCQHAVHVTITNVTHYFARRVDVRLMWERQRGRHRNRWIRQVELDTGFKADATLTAAAERDAWRALRPTAGQAVQ